MKERRPIHEGRLIDYVKEKAHPSRVMQIIEMAEKSNIICREPGTKLYTPRAKSHHKLED